MQYIDNIIFFIALVVGFGLFFKSLREIYRNIKLGKKIDTPIVVMDAEDKEIKKITGAATAGETVIMEVK